jgi:cold shock CspA family protein
MLGTVKFYDIDKGYGFIMLDCGSDVLLHHSHLVDKKQADCLWGGSKVVFDLAYRDRGAYARNIRVVNAFTWLKLPDECSHRYAVRQGETGVVKVFHNRADAEDWCRNAVEPTQTVPAMCEAAP